MRVYTVTFTAVSISAAQDLFYLKPAADKQIKLHGFEISNVGGTADAGDAQEELLRLEVIRYAATVNVGSGGTSPTPTPLLTNDTAAGFTARVNDTTPATGGGTVVLHATGLNIRVPTPYIYPPEQRPLVANAQAIVIKLPTAPADAVSCSGTAWVEEGI